MSDFSQYSTAGLQWIIDHEGNSKELAGSDWLTQARAELARRLQPADTTTSGKEWSCETDDDYCQTCDGDGYADCPYPLECFGDVGHEHACWNCHGTGLRKDQRVF